jgi:FkbM family methyltransferase
MRSMQFFSRSGEDQFLFERFFRGKRAGTFVEVGAYDGEQASNSLFFERFLGWRGLCIEPQPAAFAQLVKRRRCHCEQVCVADYEGEGRLLLSGASDAERMQSGLAERLEPLRRERLERADAFTESVVPVTRLELLLEKHSLRQIEYCSIDTGGAELGILTGLDLDRFRISVFSIESSADAERIAGLMAERGYDFVGRFAEDSLFKRRDVKPLARTSVLCAVWHADPRREQLLAGHAANLVAQNVEVEPIYIFDAGDQPPASLPGRKIIAHEPLTIYQAWNLGLALVSTPFVMNLNLDDRLAPDAIQFLEAALLREGATIAGGEWKICYSQEETDAVQPSYPAARLPFAPTWPPAPGSLTRLGSGTGERGTLGPATLWRVDAHIGVPRYPWRLADGSLLAVAGDMAWWQVVTGHLKGKVTRLAAVIGHYHSHPTEQAEFRGPVGELELLATLGISLF